MLMNYYGEYSANTQYFPLWTVGEFFGKVSRVKTIRSHRLTVRTPGFHPGNPGSIPGEITIEIITSLLDK